MKSKRYLWHKHWSWSADGRVMHDSGLKFEPSDLDLVVVQDTLPAFHAHELARGVPEWQHPTRIKTLTKEAQTWTADPRNQKTRPKD